MSPKHSFYAMIGTVAFLCCLLMAVVIVGNSWLKHQSDKLMSVKLESRLIDEQQAAVVKANKDIQKYAELEKTANTIVPQDKDQARSVRELVNIAQGSSVQIASISFPASTLGSIAPKAATGTTGGSTSTTTTVTTPSITQITAVSGIPGLYQMPITVISETTAPIPYSSLITFLHSLENNRRTAQVENITIQPSSKDPSVLTFQLGINVFIKP